jgi:hypothetical protein
MPGIGITGGRFGGGGGGGSLSVGVSTSTPAYNGTVTITATPVGITPASYTFYLQSDSGEYTTITQVSNVYVWAIDFIDSANVFVSCTDGSSNILSNSVLITVNYEHPIVNDASNIARYSFENNSDLIFNGSNISQVNDLTGNGYHLSNASAAQQPSIYSTLTVTGRQYARFVSDQLAIALASGTNYTDMTICLVMGCDGNAQTVRVGSIVQAGQNDFNGPDSIAMQEARMEKASGGGGGKYDRKLSILFFRNVEGVGTITDFFTSDGRQLTGPVNNASNGGLTYQQVNMARTNPNGVNIAEWHFIGRKLSDAETQSYGEYLRKKWLGV